MHVQNIFFLVVLSVLTAGCAAPRYSTSLYTILEQEKKNSRDRIYKYRCTAGAHRGASVEHRENTLAALLAAEQDDKYAFIEFDVQYTKDDQIVVFHDLRLLRVFGSMRTVNNSTLAELRELTGGEISTYSEIMDILDKRVNIEIKSQGDPGEDERLADEIMADITFRKRQRDVMISSISGDVIDYISRKYPHIPTGRIFWLTSSTYLHIDLLTENLYREFNETRADYLMLHVANLRNIEGLLKLKPEGKTIIFWDFDDRMYVVHKDRTDRIWGESGIAAFFKQIRFKLFSPSPRKKKEDKPIYKGSDHRFS